MFLPVPNNPSFPQLEEAILAFWKERKIYEQSLSQRAGAPRFVFYEGPPTANGMPHPGHTLRAIKDLFPRYKTMRGYLCERKAGWDTHGLPVEVEVCKELGIHAKEEIEAYGIEPFIHKCQASVWRYMKEWERLTERIGFWIHLGEAYVTYHQSYVESVWWSLKNLFDRGLLYQGFKIVWWWAQGGTALSSGEVGQGYREVADPSVFVKFPLVHDEQAKQRGLPRKTSLVVWTTTPWTLFSNMFVAVHPKLTYALVKRGDTDEHLIVAAELVDPLAKKIGEESWAVVKTFAGDELVERLDLGLRALRYLPPFAEVYYDRPANKEFPVTDRVALGNFRAPWQGTVPGIDCKSYIAWEVVGADFVTIDAGSGLVHIAPAFGEDDYEIWMYRVWDHFAEPFHGLLLRAVEPDGKFSLEVGPKYSGRWVKDCDKEICRDLKERGLMLHQEQYVHDYPFCWRAEEDPLIQYPRRSWFIRTTAFKDEMLANNERINWLPEHIKHGRFGNFLETNVDWALSRERYWGTPLPIWVCEQTGKMEAVASYDELLKKPAVQGTEVWDAAKRANPSLADDLKVHKPYIDAITYDSPFAPGAKMRRVPEVIDCWYDSGAMPFAQWGYRGEDGPPAARDRFREQFPADFIAEGLDQTRGWFYSQLAISTMLFGQSPKSKVQSPKSDAPIPQSAIRNPQSEYPHPFRNCIVWGLMLGEWWESQDGKQVFLTEAEAKQKLGDKYVKRVGKLSKQKRNYREPQTIFDTYGADALRWYLFANQPPWSSILYAERAIKDTIPEFILRLWNCYSFFVIYANIDGFDPAAVGQASRLPRERSELDRWILSELNRTCAAVVERMDAYDNYEACKRINAFVDGLSNWYVRRSRDRFWVKMDAEHRQEKLDAYWTLYECLLTTCKLIAPFTPFLAETMWRNLARVAGAEVQSSKFKVQSQPVAPSTLNVEPGTLNCRESVHLCEFPTGDASVVDETLSARMQLLREIASLGLSARMANKLKVRQPLAKVEVILSDTTHQKWLEEHDELLKDELNVKTIEYTTKADQYITYQVQPNFKRLGPRLGKLLPACKQALTTADGSKLLAEMTASGKVTLDLAGEKIELDSEDIQVRLQAKPGWAAAQGAACVVVLATELTPALIDEGKARDLVRIIQDRRKELNLQFTDRIENGIVGASVELQKAIEANREYLCSETLAVKLVFEALPGVEGVEVEIGDERITLYVKKATSD